ncbi:hypothetical protein HG535_0C00270 [Zygotorulaspora mrakii]|uniref:Putative peptidase domain-containing protein n=1 Tax=Zygotorulaspora mrakii TaxID=42260 RepID=A0A7H9B132_ZYGMR|nr:uncharacterized protein HG535_0C00270 [Zygotorulaspora mrakii]QLG71679.1 hypothetical protein HG535_0C00270 [Zygotorulaspora mrakii]
MKLICSTLTAISLFSSQALGAPVYNTNSTEELQTAVSGDVFGWSHPTFPELYHTCNDTNVRMLNAALKDSVEVSAYAKQRLLKYGVDDVYYTRWFGNGSIFTVMGVFDQLVEASKNDLLLRCDDIDGLCAAHPDTYPGYHRTSAPSETVICDYFYTSKKPLSSICFDGSIVDVGPKHYAGIDLLHRYLHIAAMNQREVSELVEELNEIVAYAADNATYAVKNTDNYLHYMADVYSSSVVAGGCLGNLS